MTALPEFLSDFLRDRYTLERELGRGGMATVYLAHDGSHYVPRTRLIQETLAWLDRCQPVAEEQ